MRTMRSECCSKAHNVCVTVYMFVTIFCRCKVLHEYVHVCVRVCVCVCVCVCVQAVSLLVMSGFFAVDTVPTDIDPVVLFASSDDVYPRYPMTRSRTASERALGPRNLVTRLRMHDYVWLATTHMVLPGSEGARLPRYIGPFRVTGMIGDTEVVLYIPCEMKIKRYIWPVQDVVICLTVHDASDFYDNFPVHELVSE